MYFLKIKSHFLAEILWILYLNWATRKEKKNCFMQQIFSQINKIPPYYPPPKSQLSPFLPSNILASIPIVPWSNSSSHHLSDNSSNLTQILGHCPIWAQIQQPTLSTIIHFNHQVIHICTHLLKLSHEVINFKKNLNQRLSSNMNPTSRKINRELSVQQQNFARMKTKKRE